jgi:hypothetical protein
VTKKKLEEYKTELRGAYWLCRALRNAEYDGVKEHLRHVLRVHELGLQMKQTGHPDAHETLSLVVEPIRILRTIMAMMAVSEYPTHKNDKDPIFYAAILKAKETQGGCDEDDRNFMGLLLEMDLAAKLPKFSEAMTTVTRKKGGNAQIVYRLQAMLDFRLWMGVWPTNSQIHARAEEMFGASFTAQKGDRTWDRFRKNLGIYWVHKDKPGRIAGALFSADNKKSVGVRGKGRNCPPKNPIW